MIVVFGGEVGYQLLSGSQLEMQRRQSSQRTIAVLNKTVVPQTKDKSHSSQACDGLNVFNHCLSPHGWNDMQHITAIACI